ncbi:MAG: sulfite reductase subunit alpha, partial [Acidobacteriota bacterium]|nr:sulfite reductase subunit alpha [Acidobacteriota bacterium]
DFDEPYATWKSALFQRLGELVQHQPSRTSAPTPGSTQPQLAASNAEAAPEPEDDRAPVASRERPFLARVVEKRALTATVSSKQTMHFAFDIENSGIAYEAGDACGIVPQNDPALVQELLYSLHFSGQIPVQLAKSQTTLYDALLNHLQITRLNRKMIEAYATIGQCQGLFQLLQPGHESYLEKYTYDRGLIDLIHDYPQVLHDPADLVAMLPRLAPRLYSISSSPLAHRGQIHTTVAVVRYQAHERQRGGVCSTLLADRRNTGDHLPLFIQPNRRFRLPREADAPVIMIGPGTGIAPFRAFLHERRALGSTGQNWLFFGERSAATDFLYREELEAMLRDQHLTRLDLAFSRDQQHKVYVQDRMMEQATALWSWLQNGASLYVCGDAARMAKDVDTALHTIAQQQGGLSDDGAREYVGRLREQSRYHRDVY